MKLPFYIKLSLSRKLNGYELPTISKWQNDRRNKYKTNKMITTFQIITAIFLFFIINLIGKFAPTDLRYFQISSFLETDEAPAFNFSFRILTPIVFIILLSTLLYSIEMDNYVEDIYFISIYYVIFRAIFNIAISRSLLINWKKQFFYAVCIVSLSYFLYQKIIITKHNLLPDFSNIANELWIIILVFLYNLVNNIQLPNVGAEKRKYNYIKTTFLALKENYGEIVDSFSTNIRFQQIAYSIMLHENFNRPKLFRLIEYINSFFKKEGTYGIMQVKSNKVLTDIESVKLGTNILLENFKKYKLEFENELENREKEEDKESYYNSAEYLDQNFQSKLIRSYNHCDDYSYEISELADYLNEKFYEKNEDNKNLFASV